MSDIEYGFFEEVKELLHKMEDDLIQLEKDPKNPEIINSVFRVMHTLKGSAGMAGYKNIQDFTHEFETLYDQIREGKISINSDIIDVTLKASDIMMSMLENPDFKADSSQLLKDVYQGSGVSEKKPDAIPNASGILTANHLYIILFSPDKEVFERGLDPDKILDEIQSVGQAHIIRHEKKTTWEEQKAKKKCNTVWEIYLRTSQNIAQVNDIFLFYRKDELNVFEISRERLEIDPFLAETLARLYKNKIMPEEQIKLNLDQLPDLVKTSVVPVANAIQKEPDSNDIKSAEESTIAVSSQKLDELMNLVSELVTLTATLEVHATQFKDAKLHNTIELVEKLTKRFRNNALDLRLVPVGSLLMKFKRQIRDLSKELGKKVNLLIEGQDIEIDKTILRSIESPLQHIIRNSIDHGLETEAVRISKGKSPEGLLKISAFYSGASVIIQVQDDGTGIDLDRVRECAVKKGYLQPDQTATKQELISMIMEPGFTTNENVTIVSGRGVGMDVVRKELNTVGGSLEVFTEDDLGTSVVMKLPTTLTILDTLMINIEQTQILIPVMDIEYCFKEKTEKLFQKDNQYLEYKSNPIPLVSLRKLFDMKSLEKEDAMVIVINKFDRQYAVVADEIVGEHQAVIKPLGALFVNQPFFSGGSIMVDGKLAFILDSNFLFNRVTKI